MVWPTDDLTTANLDAGTDDPGLARAELLAAVQKIQAILGEVTAGATVWHSGNDGAGSQLDAGTLGGSGQDAAYYRNASNINAGTLNNARLNAGAGNGLDADLLDGQHGSHYLNWLNMTGDIPASKFGTNTVNSNTLGVNAVKQANLSDTFGVTLSDSTSIGVDNYVLPGGEFCFFPQSYNSDATGTTHELQIHYQNASAPGAWTTTLGLRGGLPGGVAYARANYITNSPPFRLNDGEVPLFVWVRLRANEIISTQAANTPPWAYNGPTSIKPEFSRNGKWYRYERTISEEDGSITRTEIEINDDLKNADMDLLPHPFLSAQPADQIILIDPQETLELMELLEAGENISQLIHDDYIRIDNAPLNKHTPRGVTPVRYRWRNAQRRGGEARRDRRTRPQRRDPQV